MPNTDASQIWPRQVLLFICLVQLVLWTLSPTFSFLAPPIDVGENMIWGQAWQWGYYKHPPLQAWLTEIGLYIGFGHVWGVYFMGQLCVVATFLGLYALASDCADETVAATAVALFALVFYANVPTPQMNANTVQMPVWAWAGFALWRGINTGKIVYWLLLGLMVALGLYAKYTVLFLVATVAAATLILPQGRRSLLTLGPWLPHLQWLVANDYMPITYAENRAYPMGGLERLAGIGKFIGAQAITFLAPLAVLAVLRPGLHRPEATPAARLFVDVLALAPVGAMVTFSLVTGGAMLEMWGMPAIIWIPIAIAMRLRPVMEARYFRQARTLWIGLFVAAPLINGIYCYSMPYWGEMPFSSGFPGQKLAAKTTAIWKETVGGTPKIVAGDTLAAGIIHYFTPGNPMGFMETEYRFNPWISPQTMARDGALFVWQGSADAYNAFGPFVRQGEIVQPLGKVAVRINYAVLAPEKP
jgi:4-amino-4-deoxy-L-arabinose transferase-like glycosyltransferase